MTESYVIALDQVQPWSVRKILQYGREFQGSVQGENEA